MSLRSDLLPVFEDARQLIEDFGLRQYRVFVRVGAWSTDEIHLGSLVNTDVEILPRPKVKQVGAYTLEVSKITPNFTTGGWEPDEILPAIAAGHDLYFIAIGPGGAGNAYRLTDVDATKNFTFTLTLTREPSTLPDFD